MDTDEVLSVTAYWPSSGVDLVIEVELRTRCEVIVVEHKRFDSPSHRPGYKTKDNAPWQTDAAYDAATGATKRPPRWMRRTDADHPVKFVVLDGYGKSMDQLYPDGLHNKKWSVTSYPQLGRVLRAEHDRGVGGLVPLLATLYSGSPER
ncbi:hypothetical protein [Streptomyces sp. N35]|uniref:hypothetical protein n=1 Tax=Streptomyces sp. N35 TaxID=2795730 RepID=UPI0018F340B7|nr:hypothetical protein [Streptomyces sp. N35]